MSKKASCAARCVVEGLELQQGGQPSERGVELVEGGRVARGQAREVLELENGEQDGRLVIKAAVSMPLSLSACSRSAKCGGELYRRRGHHGCQRTAGTRGGRRGDPQTRRRLWLAGGGRGGAACLRRPVSAAAAAGAGAPAIVVRQWRTCTRAAR